MSNGAWNGLNISTEGYFASAHHDGWDTTRASGICNIAMPSFPGTNRRSLLSQSGPFTRVGSLRCAALRYKPLLLRGAGGQKRDPETKTHSFREGQEEGAWAPLRAAPASVLCYFSSVSVSHTLEVTVTPGLHEKIPLRQ
ncbi:hypothetical protein Cob_v000878 [Colletotrichum orbiculare MAFF 240422]|uniref:Uncharacterized protein n=1 Tax=Colletotrichum orbiculare (strain 104-T / ATCC 96160 / CBS 514.97 / LARS 414 / MAFF 240422) TaxID=1213857 RepID=A0A484G6L0_COLOR|nr:hypothetical protein Cob_v000878 [Colletotrichum orbiculare MAFF 240422]